jgi:hypothetical protein
MAIRRRSPQSGYASTKLPVFTTNSVGRQSPNRRQPNEAENIDNALVSLERNFEKRPGFEIVPQKTAAEATSWDTASAAVRLDLYSLANVPSSHDLWYYWYSINEENTFLVVIDFSATTTADNLFYIFRVYPTGTWEDLTPANQDTEAVVSATSRAYITHNPNNSKTAKESLKAVSLGSSVVVLNKNVRAGFSSDVTGNPTTDGKLFDLNGVVTATDDINGRKIKYYTAARVAKVFDTGADTIPSTEDDVLLGWRPALLTGIAGGGSASHIKLDSSASNVDDAYNWMTITVTHATGLSEVRLISNYVGGTTKEAYVTTNWTTHPSATSRYSINISTLDVTGALVTGGAIGVSTVRLASSASFTDDAYKGQSIVFNGFAQVYTITGYVGSTHTATISPALQSVVANGTTYHIYITNADYISADDYYYYNTAQAYLGSRVDDLSTIRLPPEKDDWFSNNSKLSSTTDTTARAMLRSLYDSDTLLNGIIDGRGKIFFTLNPYLNTTSGYYRVISWNPAEQTYYYDPADTTKGIYTYSGVTVVGPNTITHTTAITTTGRPYLQKIRTPDEHSYIDPRRMPQKLVVSIDASNVTAWNIEPIKWSARTTGDKTTNPGPSIFKTVDRKSLKHVKINSIAVFKDRLWFSADDVIFSSEMGEYESLFLKDAENIITTDPIDIRVSSNSYCEITSMTPFEEYMFINTKANIQFQLMSAAGMELSPSNVAVAPVTYYGTAPILDPQFIGSRLYFFDSQKLFLFTGKGTMGYASAVEVSSTAAGYLPKNYRTAATAPAQDTLLFVDDDQRNHIYGYVNRFSGDRVVQNSFYRYILDDTESIETLQCFANNMYVVSKRETVAGSGTYTYYLYRNYMLNEDVYVPRLDRMFKMKIINSDVQAVNYNAKYDPYTATTTYRIPGHTNITDISKYFVVLFKGWFNNGFSQNEDLSNVAIQPYSVTNITDGSNLYTEIVVIGANYAIQDYYVYIGLKFKMNVELSTLFVRDENNNIIDGVLNIRSAIFRHYFTGPYDIEVTHRGRPAFTTSYIPTRPEYTIYEDTLPLEIFQKQGEFVSKILGYSDSTVIKITSEYPTPVNITNMEFKGKFKQKYTTIDT